MTQILKIVVVVVCGNAYDMAPENPQDGPLFRFHIDVRPHLISWEVLVYNFSLIDLVLKIKILYLGMLGLLRAACLPIGFKQDGTHVVLIE